MFGTTCKFDISWKILVIDDLEFLLTLNKNDTTSNFKIQKTKNPKGLEFHTSKKRHLIDSAPLSGKQFILVYIN